MPTSLPVIADRQTPPPQPASERPREESERETQDRKRIESNEEKVKRLAARLAAEERERVEAESIPQRTDETKPKGDVGRSRIPVWARLGGGLAALAVLAGVIILLIFANSSRPANVTPTAAQAGAVITATAAPFATQIPVALPSVTLSLTPVPSATPQASIKIQAAHVSPGDTVLYVGDAYKAGADSGQLRIYHSSLVTEGYLYVVPASGLTFDYVDTDKGGVSTFILKMDPGSQGYLYTGGYKQGQLIITALNLSFFFQGCFAIQYNAAPAAATAGCYGGDCAYSLSTGDRTSIAEGSQLSFDGSGKPVAAPVTIPDGDVRFWADLLPPDSPAALCVNRLAPNLTISPTITSTSLPNLPRTATNTARPAGPSSTPKPLSTFTPTNTPLPTRTPLPTKTRVPTKGPTPTPTRIFQPPNTPTRIIKPPNTPTSTPKP
jgi:hypothetical protein